MKGQDRLFEWFSEWFGDLLVGRNVKGIVHNLNGPLQILSMQLELLNMDLNRCLNDVQEVRMVDLPAGKKREDSEVCNLLARTSERVSQLQEVVSKVDSTLRVIGQRTENPSETMVIPIILNQLLQEELDFWKSDLFFKHKVSLELQLSDSSPVVLLDAKVLRNLLDSLIMAVILQLKKVPLPAMKVECCTGHGASEAESRYIIKISHNGPAFELETLSGMETASREGRLPEGVTPEIFALYMARGWAKSLDIQLNLTTSDLILEGVLPRY